MRTDILPLCDAHFRAMEQSTAPYNAEYSIEFFRCTAQFCRRCFSERLGYVTPKWGEAPDISPRQQRCEYHSRPMFISSLDRQRNLIRYACPEPGCQQTATESVASGSTARLY